MTFNSSYKMVAINAEGNDPSEANRILVAVFNQYVEKNPDKRVFQPHQYSRWVGFKEVNNCMVQTFYVSAIFSYVPQDQEEGEEWKGHY